MLFQSIASNQSVLVAITLCKNHLRVSHTLAYSRNADFVTLLIKLVFHYDTMRRSVLSNSKYYWNLPPIRHSKSAATIFMWLSSCLAKINVKPPPQVKWNFHSLRMAAVSKCSKNLVEEYRILI